MTAAGLEVLDTVEAIAREHNAPVAAVSLAWILAQPGVSAAIVGPDTPGELLQCAHGAHVELSDGELRRLDGVAWLASDPEFVNW